MNTDLLNMTMQLSMQDTFTSSWFTSAIMQNVWMELVRARVDELIQRSNKNLDLLGEALGGRLRGDAAMLRGASSNVLEARSMMETAALSVARIAEQTGEAQKLMREFLGATAGMSPGDQTYDALLAQYAPRYEAVSKNINSIIKSAQYNGIALLDGAAWAADKRISRTPGDVAGAVQIQAGMDAFPLTFNNMRTRFFGLASTYALSGADASTMNALGGLQETARILAEFYTVRAGSLKGQAASLQSQAAILEEAALRRSGGGSSESAASLLLNLILQDTGSLFSGKG